MCRRRKTDTHPSMAWPGSGPNEWFQRSGSDTGSAASAFCFIATKKPAAAPRSWEHKLRQRLWNGTGGVYDAFLIDVHLKKREWNASIQLGDAPSRPSSPSCHRQRGSQAGGSAEFQLGCRKRRWQRSLFGAKLPLCVQIWIVEMLGMKMGNSCKQLLNPPVLAELLPLRRISCVQSG